MFRIWSDVIEKRPIVNLLLVTVADGVIAIVAWRKHVKEKLRDSFSKICPEQ